MHNEALFKDKPVWTAILSMAVPSVFSVLVMVLYNMADMFFVGQLGDNAQVAAVSVVGPIFSLITAVSTMVGVGGCAIIARSAGEGEYGFARICASLCIWVCIAVGVIAAVLLNIFTVPILSLLGATPDVMQHGEAYLRVLACGAPFMLLSTGCAMLMRAEGAIKEGFFINVLGTVVNLVLDPLFILVLKLGVTGAAVATVIGNMTGTAFFMMYILRKADILNLNPRLALKKPSALLQILALGLPNALSGLLSGLASTFSNRLLSAYGTAALAAMGASGKVTMLISLVQMGICMGVQPLMAYNYGANNLPRLKEVIKKLAILTFGFGTAATLICTVARKTLIGLFLQDAAAAEMGQQLVVYLLLAGPVLGLYYIGSNFLQASGNAAAATVASVLRQGALLIPFLHLFRFLFGFTGVAAAYTAADLVSVVITCALAYFQLRKLTRRDRLSEATAH